MTKPDSPRAVLLEVDEIQDYRRGDLGRGSSVGGQVIPALFDSSKAGFGRIPAAAPGACSTLSTTQVKMPPESAEADIQLSQKQKQTSNFRGAERRRTESAARILRNQPESAHSGV